METREVKIDRKIDSKEREIKKAHSKLNMIKSTSEPGVLFKELQGSIESSETTSNNSIESKNKVGPLIRHKRLPLRKRHTTLSKPLINTKISPSSIPNPKSPEFMSKATKEARKKVYSHYTSLYNSHNESRASSDGEPSMYSDSEQLEEFKSRIRDFEDHLTRDLVEAAKNSDDYFLNEETIELANLPPTNTPESMIKSGPKSKLPRFDFYITDSNSNYKFYEYWRGLSAHFEYWKVTFLINKGQGCNVQYRQKLDQEMRFMNWIYNNILTITKTLLNQRCFSSV